MMNIPLSLEKRNMLTLLIFFIFDHLLWYFCGFFKHVSLFYIIMSEVVRLIAMYGIINSFFSKKHVHMTVFIIVIYCFLMIPFSFYAGRSHYYADGSLLDNPLQIRKEKEIPVDYPIIAIFSYMYFMTSMYYFAWKHLDKNQDEP